MRFPRRCTGWIRILALGLCALVGAQELRAESWQVKGLKLLAAFCRDYMAGKVVDWATGQDLGQQLKKEIPRLVTLIAAATGPERAALQESLDVHHAQLAVLERLTAEHEKKISGIQADQQRQDQSLAKVQADQDQQRQRLAAIQADQDRLSQRIQSLASRMEALERRVDRIDSRVDELDSRLRQVEEALIRECLDLRSAAILGVDEYRVKETPGGWMSDRFDSDELSLDVRLLLNSCSADLTRRGLMIQLSLVTRNLDQDLRLYATWKDVNVGSYGQGPRRYDRQEFTLARPVYRLDGQVAELFIPYDEIPGFGSADRLALALVLTHDGTVLYSLPDRLVSCNFGQRVQCRWGR